MRSADEILILLDRLGEGCVADDLEDQDLDFKRWIESSMDDAVSQVVEMAVCMANGGGGTVVFGVADQSPSRRAALLGVPERVSVKQLVETVYRRTDPSLAVYFEELEIPEGTARLLAMQVLGE